MGYWALGYDGNDPAFWEMVDRVTLIPSPDDTGEPDTGEPDTGVPDTGEADSGVADDGSPVDVEEKPGGCSCATTTPPQLGWLAIPLVGLVMTRRRR